MATQRRRGADSQPVLTSRQRVVLDHVRAGRSNREIAEDLGITEHGVKAHVARLLAKFNVANRAALAGAAVERAAPEGDDPLRALTSSLAEVLGAPIATALVRRSARRAGLDPERFGAGLPPEQFAALLRALWPLLIEMTGQAVLARLAARGVEPASEPGKEVPS